MAGNTAVSMNKFTISAMTGAVGLYREKATAIESEAKDPFGGNVYNTNYAAHSGMYA